MRNISTFLVAGAIALAGAVNPAFAAFLAGGGINQNSPTLPPSTGGYVSPDDVHTCFDIAGFGNSLCLLNGDHSFFVSPFYTTISGTNNGLDQFDSTFTGTATGGPFGGSTQPVVLNGSVSIILFNRPTNDLTGTFSTEMTQLDLSGGGIMIRESPTLASTGQTRITDLGGGNFHIDSFFDIFTELSLDDGVTWTPGTLTHVDLVTPEPGTMLLLGAGCLGLAFLRKRKA